MAPLSAAIIIAAARSGTNVLRDCLVQIPGVETWPCDEINYVWRYRNARCPTDEFTPSMATPAVKAFIRREFERLARARKAQCVVEKTCANSLRVPFVNAVLPEAKFIHIARDGRDAAVSAAERWCAPLDIPYVLKKARYIPLSELPYHACRYGIMWLRRAILRERRIRTWGPRFEGIDKVFESETIHVACAIQWARCVDKADGDLARIEPSRVHRLRYEDFVLSPADKLRDVLDFLGVEASPSQCRQVAERVRTGSVGRWCTAMPDSVARAVQASIGGTLARLGYK